MLESAWWAQLEQPWEDDDDPENVNRLFVEYMKSKGREIEEGDIEDDELEADEPEYDINAMLEERLGRPPLRR